MGSWIAAVNHIDAGVDAEDHGDVTGQRRVDGRLLRTTAYVLATTAYVLFVVGNGYAAAAAPSLDRTTDTVLGIVLYAVPCVVALLVMLQRPRNPIGWILVVSVLGIGIASFGSFVATRDRPLGEWLEAFGILSVALLATVLPLLFPDGRLPSRHWRPVLVVSVAATIVIQLALLFRGGQLFDSTVENPLGVDGTRELLGGVIAAAFIALVLSGAAALASLVVRFRNATGEERLQLRWILLGFMAVAAGLVVFWIPGVPYEIETAVQSIAVIAVLPLCLGVALVRHRLLDIDVVIRRTVVYGLLWLAITAVYVGVAAALGVAAGRQVPVAVAVLLTIGAAMAFEPARRKAQAFADRWVFGPRPPDHELLATFSHDLDDADVSERLAKAVGVGLGMDWVRVQVGDQSHTFGEVTGPSVISVPIEAGDGDPGSIECGKHDRGVLGEREVNLVQALAVQAGLLVANQRLAARLVHAGEVERRRLERNLHDGTQQQLIALVAGLGAARDSIGGDAQRVLDLLGQLQKETLTVLHDVREIARGIHPSVLTDGGLVEAVRERCAGLPVPATVIADQGIRTIRLPDEVEGAAYFCVLEAIANALKHGSPRTITVELTFDGAVLGVDVVDDGCGFDTETTPRHGLVALGDRAAALSGEFSVQSDPLGGTRMAVRLPTRPLGTAHD